jgi:16S rRNA processing protein RimM
MGRVLAPYGVKGWLKIRPFSEAVDGLLSHSRWLLSRSEDGPWREGRLLEGKAHGSVLVAHIEGVDDRTQAEALTGLHVAIPRGELPAAEVGEFYWADLVGLEVINEQGVALGTVIEVISTGAHAVLKVVQFGVRGDGERLIPFVDAYVKDVDLSARRIRADWQPDY